MPLDPPNVGERGPQQSPRRAEGPERTERADRAATAAPTAGSPPPAGEDRRSADAPAEAATPAPGEAGAHGTAPAEAGREVELKLLVSPDDAERLGALACLRRGALGEARTERLHSIYFDTPERVLLEQAIALRVRRVGTRFIQTVKAQERASAGLFSRSEVEGPIDGPLPDLAAIADAQTAARVAALVRDAPLEPVLETEVSRTSRRISAGQSEVSCDLDFGEIRTPNGTLPIAELELELVRGSARDLYALALDIHEGVPLRVGTRSKYERGLALLKGERPTPRKRTRPVLARDSSVEAALEAVLRSGLDQLLANEEAACEGLDPEGVHQMRIGVRRLRSALSVFRELLPREQLELLREELRWLARGLGAVRDLDVFVLETLAPVMAIFPHEPGMKRIADAADEVRRHHQQQLRERVASPRYGGLVLGLAGWIESRGWRDQALTPEAARLFQPAREMARAVLARRARKVRRMARRIERKSVPELHQLRIELKKLRYASEFFGSLFERTAVRRYTRSLARMQGSLGGLNDAVMAEHVLAEVIESMHGEATAPVHQAGGMVLGWTSRGAREELRRLSARWRQLHERPAFWNQGRKSPKASREPRA